MVAIDISVALRDLIIMAVSSYRYVIFVRIILSWIPIELPEALRPAVNFLYDVTEPFLRVFRRMLPSVGVGGMGLDLSPIIGFVVLIIVERVLWAVLF